MLTNAAAKRWQSVTLTCCLPILLENSIEAGYLVNERRGYLGRLLESCGLDHHMERSRYEARWTCYCTTEASEALHIHSQPFDTTVGARVNRLYRRSVTRHLWHP